MKEILRNKRKLEGHETIMFNEECSDILLNKLPPKLKNSGSFTILCIIGNSYFEKPYAILMLVLTDASFCVQDSGVRRTKIN